MTKKSGRQGKGQRILFTIRVNELWEAEQFDMFAEKECAAFYAETKS
jgi:hypothetical protein